MAVDAYRIEAGAAEVEEPGEVDDRLDIILRRALKSGCIVPLIAAHGAALSLLWRGEKDSDNGGL